MLSGIHNPEMSHEAQTPVRPSYESCLEGTVCFVKRRAVPSVSSFCAVI
jgi:hypothetical protein